MRLSKTSLDKTIRVWDTRTQKMQAMQKRDSWLNRYRWDKTDIHFTGAFIGYDDKPTTKWSQAACFAPWGRTDREIPLKYIEYQPNIDKLAFDKGVRHIYRTGYEKVLRKVYSLIPPYYQLRQPEFRFRMSVLEMPMNEINVNMRVVRALQEHRTLVETAAWLYYLYPDIPAPVLLTVAASFKVDHKGLTGSLQMGTAHTSLATNGSSYTMLSMLRSFQWMETHGGRFWVDAIHKPGHPFDRKVYGYDREMWGRDTTPFPIRFFGEDTATGRNVALISVLQGNVKGKPYRGKQDLDLLVGALHQFYLACVKQNTPFLVMDFDERYAPHLTKSKIRDSIRRHTRPW